MDPGDLKWYTIFVLLVQCILSFADPITDILTLEEFYRQGHKTWFVVGLTFVVLPCVVFGLVYIVTNFDLEEAKYKKCLKILLSFTPFAPAFARLWMLAYCSRNAKKLWQGDGVKPSDGSATDRVFMFDVFAPLIEAVLESAPQFIIQLYAISVQREPISVIQIISLAASFASYASTFTSVDELKTELRIIHKVMVFVVHLLLLSSRLFAIVYFTVSYKWWIMAVLGFHCIVVGIINCVTAYNIDSYGFDFLTVVRLSLFTICHWLRDDFTENGGYYRYEEDVKPVICFMRISNVLFVAENLTMILMFYFGPDSDTWYALPVTICVCCFSVVGAILRAIHMERLIWENSDVSFASVMVAMHNREMGKNAF